MNYTITGSLGNISKPLVQQLTAAGHTVTVISSSRDKQADIEALGAKAAIGSVTDRQFLIGAFAGSDAVYLMIPPSFSAPDNLAYQKLVADNYIEAIKANNIAYVVQLSSLGAHLREGAGPIDGPAYLETELEKLKNVNVKVLRPSYFYYNFMSMYGMIRHAGIMGGNFGGNDEKMILVHPSDIAAVAAQLLLSRDFKGFSHVNIASDERHTSEVAAVLGKAIGKPELPWVVFSDEQSLEGAIQAGISPSLSAAYVQMGKAFREGRIQEQYWQQQSAPQGKIKLEDFAREFAAVYNASN